MIGTQKSNNVNVIIHGEPERDMQLYVINKHYLAVLMEFPGSMQTISVLSDIKRNMFDLAQFYIPVKQRHKQPFTINSSGFNDTLAGT